ncbi:MAG TPA: RnfABCDGE type electron transport complex subunit D [Acidimicrobiales bacterium]|nr:RnfABCDGE type electron transport complex subunit D [Acidimicrobiales bacterium]
MTTTSTGSKATEVATPSPIPAGPTLTLGRRSIPIVLPKWSDPRLKLSATILTLTILGQTILNFQVSIPQILACVLPCALIEIAVTMRRERVLIWPASAIQTGISVAFIFRVGGTRHGDLWTTRGLQYFLLVVALSMLPKYLLRRNGRHIFNPSNIGLAWGLLLIGPSHVFSEHLWWAPLGVPVLVSMAVIFGGGWWVLRQVRMLPMAGAFLATFFVLIGIFAVGGRSYYATWHQGPVGGSFYWLTIALSPELLIFVFFMISDPQTSPKSQLGRVIYAITTATVAAGLVLLQSTEFGIKVAILSSLLVTCALVPSIERLSGYIQRRRAPVPASVLVAPPPALQRRVAAAVRNPVLVAALIIAVAAPVNTALLARDHKIVLIERGLTGRSVQ